MDKENTGSAAGALIACLLGGALMSASGAATGLSGRGSPAQELAGPVSRDTILNVLPESRSERGAYLPAAGVLDRIRAFTSAIRVEAFFASGDAEQVKAAGRLMKIEDGVSSFNFTTEFTALSGPADPIAVQRGFDALPAFLVFVDGVESGRIAGPSESPLEYELAARLPPLPSEGLDDELLEDDIYADRDYFRGIPHAHLPIDCTRCHRPR
ncbi:MAG: hypothetical protein JW742_03560 [Candidatus Aminicenantes bacterium]|nr:hypothetical protein [Candidatus Aminicenantes bacterium]